MEKMVELSQDKNEQKIYAALTEAFSECKVSVAKFNKDPFANLAKDSVSKPLTRSRSETKHTL